MITEIYRMDERTGNISREASYSLPAEDALMTHCRRTHGVEITGMRHSDSRQNTVYADYWDRNTGKGYVYMAYQESR